MGFFLRFSLLIVLCVWVNVPFVHSQQRIASYQKYIEQYADLAIRHQQKFKIPASITLAQGILESGAGQSELARKSNNHFGIKCHSDWTGGRVYHNDDYQGECFRKYAKVEESYEDHSHFLADRPRYEPLFRLNITDYKGWARGLQQCGYATDRAYANKLIKVVEDYELYRYDSAKGGRQLTNKGGKLSRSAIKQTFNREIFKTHGLIYVYARMSDNFDQIAHDLDFKVKDLVKYNEVPEDFPFQQGDIIYLQKKKKKADKPHYDHVVQVGESMHSISQTYGIQIVRLYKMNKKPLDYVPEEGDVLKLR